MDIVEKPVFSVPVQYEVQYKFTHPGPLEGGVEEEMEVSGCWFSLAQLVNHIPPAQ